MAARTSSPDKRTYYMDAMQASLVGRTTPGRIYRDLIVDGTEIDFLDIDDQIVGYMLVDDAKQIGHSLARVPIYDEICNAVFVMSVDIPQRQLAYFPDDWGHVYGSASDPESSAGDAPIRELEPAAQLTLLTNAELQDFEQATRMPDAVTPIATRDALISALAERFSAEDIKNAIIRYMLRRGTKMDTVNPSGSVPVPTAANFTQGITQDPAAVEMLGLNAAGLPQDGSSRRLNRAQRRAAKRAEQAQTRRGSRRTTGPTPATLALEAPLPAPANPHFRITQEMIDFLEPSDPYIAELLDDIREPFNRFIKSATIPAVPPIEVDPHIPEEYRKRRQMLNEILAAADEYLENRHYDRTWIFVQGLYNAITGALKKPDHIIGPDTTPHTVAFEDIEVRPGVPWLSEEIIEDFVDYLRYGGQRPWYSTASNVVYTPSTGTWVIRDKTVAYDMPGSVERLESEFGVPDYNGLKVFESLLNVQQPKFNSEDKTATVMEKQDLVLDEFRRWLGKDPWRRWMVEEGYNNFFNKYKTHSYDGSRLKFPGLSEDVELYPYQKNAVAQILAEKNTLLAFDVGAGKTYIMAAAAMNLRKAKKSPKNLFVVPNNIVGQWERIFHSMYPDAKLKVVEPKTFAPAVRNEVLADIRDNDYDGIIMAYSSFELIRLSSKEIERQRKEAKQYFQKDLRKFSRYDSAGTKARQYANAVDKEADAVMKSIAAKSKEDVTLDQLGITTMFLDEAHNFKNVPIRSALKNVAGINLNGSQKNLNMLYKIRAVQNNRKRGGVVFATGTPLSNSLADCYTMQRYLQPELMREAHFDVFDNWLKSFAKPEFVCEIDVDTSKFRYVNRLSRFYNLPELSRMFAGNAAFYALDDDTLPELKGYTNVLIPEDPNLREYMDDLCDRTEKIRAGEVPPFIDNMLKISVDGRKAALDLRLVGYEQPYTETSKVYRCVQEVLKVYREDPNFTQIIFCDYSTPKAHEFNVYDDLKKHLMEEGVPEKEIAFIHSATTETKKKELYEKMNAGKIRILIGSTFKLGIGANVQTKLKAIHHLDVPWRPADMVQREGRILRKGNTNDAVKIYRYITEGSFDAYSWQILEAKQKFISQFLTGSTYQRSATDLEDNVLTYAQVKALAINEPLMKTLAEKQNELRRVRLLAANHVQTQDTRRGGMDKLRDQESMLRQFAKRTQENAASLKDVTDKEFKELYKKIAEFYPTEVVNGDAPIPEEGQELLGFKVELPPAQDRQANKPILLLSRNDATYRVAMGDKTAGNARRLVNFLRKFDDHAQKAEQRADAALGRIEGNEKVLGEENPFPAQIAHLETEIRQLQNEIIQKQQTRAREVAAMQPA